MLRVDLAAADERPVAVSGEVQPNDKALTGLGFQLKVPVKAAGRISSAGEGRYYWRGQIGASVLTDCRRCLTSAETEINLDVDVLFTEQQETDDPSVYVIPEGVRFLDLAETIREELVLSVSDYNLCRDDCKGLCPRCGADWNVGACKCKPEPDPRWAGLEALRGTPPGNEDE